MPTLSDSARLRVVITGAEGFVGPYVIRALREARLDHLDILATTYKSAAKISAEKCQTLDVTNDSAVRDTISGYQPTHVVHLAGLAATGAATLDRQNVWRVHVGGTINIAEAILDAVPRCCLVYIGSGLIYGDNAKSGLPVDETTLLAPVDNYGATKAAADLAVGALSHRGLHVIRMRPFNHTGPGQTEAFVIPAFAAQVARIESGSAPPIIRVGNLDPERDFLDVRDVANAYALAVLNSTAIQPNTVFNIASGVARRVGDVLDWFLRHSSKKITIEQDNSRVRPSDLPRIVGNSSRARQMLGWTPKKEFDETLSDILSEWRQRSRAA